MRKALILAILVGALMGAFLLPSVAQASPADNAAVEGILASHHSPLPAYTIEAFAVSHPTFNVGDYLTVVWAESSLGTTGGSFRYDNPGNIMWGGPHPAVSKPWLTLQTGYFLAEGGRKFGAYASMYQGQRAAILLLWAHYQPLMGRWQAFADVWYGRGVPGEVGYVRNLYAAHALIVKEAAQYGAHW